MPDGRARFEPAVDDPLWLKLRACIARVEMGEDPGVVFQVTREHAMPAYLLARTIIKLWDAGHRPLLASIVIEDLQNQGLYL